MKLSPGTSLGRYEIQSEVGNGGMGVVYKAKDTTLGRTVAIKVLKPELVRDDQGFERFKREAKAIAGLSHANIISLYDFGAQDDIHFAVMEFVQGKPLESCIDSLNTETVLGLASGIAEGLSAAHQGGIVHRDIKPSNIIINERGEPKLLDFGLASVISAHPFNDETMSPSDLQTQAGTIMGTVGYMSPEQVRGQKADERSDIFSFGVVLYEMLNQKRAFRRDSAIETMSAILTQPLPEATELEQNDNPILAIAAKCLEKDAQDRFQSMTEVLDALSKASPTNTETVNQRTGKPVALGGVLLLAITLIALFMFGNNSDDVQEDKQSDTPSSNIDIQLTAEQAINTLLPDLLEKVDAGQIQQAFEIAQQAEPFLKGNKLFDQASQRVSMMYNINSIPDAADVYIGDYGSDPAMFQLVGETPIKELKLSRSPKVIILKKEGYHEEIMTSEHTFFSTTFDQTVALMKDNEIPEGMARVFATEAFPLEGMAFDRDLEMGLGFPVAEFYMDRTEVTNGKFKEFVDAGGYTNSDFWTEPIMREGNEVTFEDSRRIFTDATGRPGPASWRGGSAPTGKEDYPVQGVSWYEAKAYATWAGKDLPSYLHFSAAANVAVSAEGVKELVRRSNINTNSYAPVSSNLGISKNGIYDLCGNVAEWTLNASGNDRISVGGSAEDPPYFFGLANPIDPLDRSQRQGFRCVKFLTPATEEQLANVEIAIRDYTDAQPVSEEIFTIYKSQFSYDDAPLNPTLIERDEDSTSHYIKEIWEIDAVYDNERIIVYVHLPKNTSPPYQSLVYFHHAGSIISTPIAESELGADRNAFITQSGRAFVQPVLKGMYERKSGLKTWSANDTQQYADFCHKWVKDYRRTIDYLVSREDFDQDRICYIGDSWGSFNWLIIGAVEPRIDAAITIVGGLSMTPARPEVDQINFVTRVKQPTLYLAGAYDPIFPLARSVRPAFELLGTPDDKKQLIVLEVGHMFPENDLISNSLDFLDAEFGTPK
ncbi:MAG: hypothetical protein CMJ82_11500 [Planctomycetaceae bacterium]|nr:hypothetical protein [Planctomycetaceae bacterium]